MADNATCAKCGEKKDLCNSTRISGIKQPRVYKDCLSIMMKTGDYESISDAFWFKQIVELNDTETLEALKKGLE